MTIASETDYATLLAGNERQHVEAQREARRRSNARIRGVVDARDAGWSYGAIARAMNEGRAGSGYAQVRPGDLTHLIASGYPEDDEPS